MPNGHEHKEFGNHEYLKHGTSNCGHGCGCWMGNSNSGGPIGLDPFGKCPNNPIDGKRRDGQTDYHDVVEQRISGLENRALTAEAALKAVSPDKRRLVKTIENLKMKLFRKELIIDNIKECLRQKW